ncbi:hypothetical protein [Streptomyces sp. NPDC002588]|uniref:hypothetical protein n=1 Tax=Streptomyces sp. NPDC002588 TaxID=3154419 RepID=UPI0033267795
MRAPDDLLGFVLPSDDELRPLVRALWARDEPAVLAELEVLPASAQFLGVTTARRIAEAVCLPGLLDRHPSRTTLLSRASRARFCGVSPPSAAGAWRWLRRRRRSRRAATRR